MNNIEDKMIKLFCDINNPKPKEWNLYFIIINIFNIKIGY
jgi:hypothetical protein